MQCKRLSAFKRIICPYMAMPVMLLKRFRVNICNFKINRVLKRIRTKNNSPNYTKYGFCISNTTTNKAASPVPLAKIFKY